MSNECLCVVTVDVSLLKWFVCSYSQFADHNTDCVDVWLRDEQCLGTHFIYCLINLNVEATQPLNCRGQRTIATPCYLISNVQTLIVSCYSTHLHNPTILPCISLRTLYLNRHRDESIHPIMQYREHNEHTVVSLVNHASPTFTSHVHAGSRSPPQNMNAPNTDPFAPNPIPVRLYLYFLRKFLLKFPEFRYIFVFTLHFRSDQCTKSDIDWLSSTHSVQSIFAMNAAEHFRARTF